MREAMNGCSRCAHAAYCGTKTENGWCANFTTPEQALRDAERADERRWAMHKADDQTRPERR